MGPAISTGAAIVVEPVRPQEVRPGDVITFRSAENRDLLITHRVIDTGLGPDRRPAFRTQGDANEAPDLATVTSDRLIGRVVFDVPYVGQMVEHLRSPAAFVLLMVVPGVLLVLMELRELARGVSDLQKRRKTAS
jgi:signal peptidase